MWWKIYFWISVVLLSFGLLAVFVVPYEISPGLVLEYSVSAIAVVGLYSFVFAKQFTPVLFWKFFIWVYIFYELAYAIKIFLPNSPVQKFLGFLSDYENVTVEFFVISFLAEIPLLYALYKLTKSEYHVESSTKPVLVEAKNAPKWGMIQTALWGYNTVFTLLIFLMSFSTVNTGKQEASDITSGLALFAPLMLFWLCVLFKYKQYHWNWWRTTLVANSLLYSGLILFGIVATVEGEASSGDFDIIGILQIFILFISLVVFGRDQFPQLPKTKSLEKKS